ncbi:unnamed protein product [Arabidopsis lyrata]|uniref:DUF1308 domain-containing protein n=1 Tax=Arabidopsis lyrata subsp. lyrata TaxID=81972 RepID=D7KRA0_ARALL|nr:UPF0415 protein C7orf25 homolog [Arabidopsis lyrata subsp. lyrata]EFH63739.1 hypothetical protein ARALYDRAFT_895197 [Arabidopsis lyrata subsp. lyrata]CAH8258039.1 unnamed protein product [Arabidopsis lyrata]|eukprot:XP_002887480.1 UPF0415 protein C7orf25 homolog [Arabidopsis lyrata subsp. lyrata]
MEIGEIEISKQRCESVIRTIENLPLSTAITASCRRTLLKLASSELSFLSSLSSVPSPQPLSVNIGHIESVVRILQLPSVTGVSRVCKPIPLPIGGVHVDLVCTLGKVPVWIIVSDRNPRYISWSGDRHGSKGLRSRIEQILAAANSTTTLKPSSVILFFANGLPCSIYEKLKDEFGAAHFDFFGLDSDSDISMLDDFDCEWVNVVRTRSYKEAVSVEIKLIDQCDSLASPETEVLVQEDVTELSQKDVFSSVISSMRLLGEDCLINFDTTALVALVSGISNGCAERIVHTPEIELEEKFKGNTVFVIAQARSEIEKPGLVKMGSVLSGKRGIVCKSVLSEFKELVSMYAGPNEKLRAEQLLKSLMVVNDNPSERVMSLPTTRKLAMKNKTVFGTGDRWGAPTLTANMAFVRAVAQSGMSLSTNDHSPRALTGD